MLALALAASVVTDLRKRLILNAVTYPALALVLAACASLGGPELALSALIGVLICALPLFLAMLGGAMGAGDVKLMAVCGAVACPAGGPLFAVSLFLFVSVAGGLQAIAWVIAARARGQARPQYVPYGVAIAAGTVFAFFWGPLF